LAAFLPNLGARRKWRASFAKPSRAAFARQPDAGYITQRLSKASLRGQCAPKMSAGPEQMIRDHLYFLVNLAWVLGLMAAGVYFGLKVFL
jgi:hypothetical protein